MKKPLVYGWLFYYIHHPKIIDLTTFLSYPLAYPSKLYRGVGCRRISHIMTQKEYRSSSSNGILKPNYIYSI